MVDSKTKGQQFGALLSKSDEGQGFTDGLSLVCTKTLSLKISCKTRTEKYYPLSTKIINRLVVLMNHLLIKISIRQISNHERVQKILWDSTFNLQQI